jgi:lambda family phage portal protein
MTEQIKTKPDLKKLNRSFMAAQYGNMLDLNESLSINADIQNGLETIRRRARSIVMNNGYAKGIVQNYQDNIVGSRGINFTCQAKDPNGALDVRGNQLIEDEFSNWGKYGNCTVEGNLSWAALQSLVLRTVAIDGEALIMIRRGEQFGRHQIQLELIPVDQLDANFYSVCENGNVIFQSVELNAYGKAVAYHIWQHNRNDMQLNANRSNQRIRVPASDIIHLYEVQSPKMVRGISWFVASLINLHHTDLLQTTELQMARLASLKQCIYKIDKPEDFQIDDDLLDACGMINKTLSPGGVEVLPPGVSMESVDWASPNSSIENFTKVILRGISAGMGVAYNSISGDLESTSYSSARVGMLEDRVRIQTKQRWFIDAFVNRVYEAWLETAFITVIPFPMEKLPKFQNVKWSPRGFESVDPQKQNTSDALSLLLGTATRSEICATRGLDYIEVLHGQIQEERARIDAYAAAGIPLPINQPQYVPIAVASEQSEAKSIDKTED